MKVLHVIPTLLPRSGGGDRACAELCESLAAQGLEVSLVFCQDSETDIFKPEGVKLYPCRQSKNPLLKTVGYSREMNRLMRQLVSKHNLLHIHSLYNYPAVTASRAAVDSGVPYIVQPHGSLHPWKLRHHRFRKWIFNRFVDRRILESAVALHAESENDRSDILNFFPHPRVFIVPCGVFSEKLNEPTRWKSAAERWPQLGSRKYILYLGRIDHNKGVDVLLTAFRENLELLKDHILFIAGPDHANMVPGLQRLSNRLGISERVIWTGMITEEERKLAFKHCNFFILPSLSENFGITVVEAMFCAKPVIATTATPWNMLQECGAGVVVPPTVEGISRALGNFGKMSPEELNEMGEHGKALAHREYEWNSIAQSTTKIYTEILEDS